MSRISPTTWRLSSGIASALCLQWRRVGALSNHFSEHLDMQSALQVALVGRSQARSHVISGNFQTLQAT